MVQRSKNSIWGEGLISYNLLLYTLMIFAVAGWHNVELADNNSLLSCLCGAHPAISHCSNLLLK